MISGTHSTNPTIFRVVTRQRDNRWHGPSLAHHLPSRSQRVFHHPCSPLAPVSLRELSLPLCNKHLILGDWLRCCLTDSCSQCLSGACRVRLRQLPGCPLRHSPSPARHILSRSQQVSHRPCSPLAPVSLRESSLTLCNIVESCYIIILFKAKTISYDRG
jgi:hypothetical protein